LTVEIHAASSIRYKGVQIMKVHNIKFIVIASSLCLAACGSADDENSFSGALNEGFEEGWSEEFVKSCVAEAVKVGAAESDARPACDCVSDKLLPTLDGFSEKVNPPEEKMDAALRACDIPGN